MKPVLYLASKSPRRRQLLKTVGIDYEPVSSGDILEENIHDLPPAEYAVWLALLKASTTKEVEDGLVLGADTIVVQRGEIIEKPSDEKEAIEHLKKLSGKWHTVITGMALVKFPEAAENIPEKPLKTNIGVLSESQITAFEATRVLFSELEEKDIEAYVNSREPSDKAGAYGIQKKGALLVKRVEGCFYNVVGLPLFRLTTLLKHYNISREELIASGGLNLATDL